MPTEIDNPGGGDCGFYAMAIGLIDVIQKNTYDKDDEILNKWQQLDPKMFANNDINSIKQQILEIDLTQLKKYPHTYQKNALYELQMSLRRVAAARYLLDMETKISRQKDLDNAGEGGTVLHTSHALIRFAALVQGIIHPKNLNKDGAHYHFNELALKNELTELAKKTVTEIKGYSEYYGSSFAAKNQIETDLSLKAFNENQELIKDGLKYIENPGRWATHDDLKEIAEGLGINLLITGEYDGQPVDNGASINELPCVNLINHGSFHWTTNVNLPKPAITNKIEAKTPANIIYQKYNNKPNTQSATNVNIKLILDGYQEIIEKLLQYIAEIYKKPYESNLHSLFNKSHTIITASEALKANKVSKELQEQVKTELDLNLQDDDVKLAIKLQAEDLAEYIKPKKM
jgi:hypothetical protein